MSASSTSMLSPTTEAPNKDDADSSTSSGSSHPAFKRITSVIDEHGRTIDRPRLPFISRYILCGFSYGALIASSIPPPMRDPTKPALGHLPTTYIFISYPAGVGWFLVTGQQSSFYNRAKAHLTDGYSERESVAALKNNDSPESTKDSDKGKGKDKGGEDARQQDQSAKAYRTKAYFITGGQDQFTSPKTLQTWLKNYAGLDAVNSMTLSDNQQQETQQTSGSGASRSGEQQPQQADSPRRRKNKHRYAKPWSQVTSIADRDGARIQLDILQDADHFWIDREDELLMRLENWWESTHPVTAAL
ncbi:hypothetical protein BGW41_006351 [Actinomortierella wolfii]|nr:hypothetical protein BGW41_006351 [Actinomortierella wolfii]